MVFFIGQSPVFWTCCSWIIQRTIPRVEIGVTTVRTVALKGRFLATCWRISWPPDDSSDLDSYIHTNYIYMYMCVYIYIYIFVYLFIYVCKCVFVCIWTYNDIMKYVFNLFYFARGVQCVFFKCPKWGLNQQNWDGIGGIDSTLIPGVLGLYIILMLILIYTYP